MKKILIIVCSGTINKGTEALVRGTIILLEKAFKSIQVTLASSTPEIDTMLKLPYVVSCIPRINRYKRFSKEHLFNKIKMILGDKGSYYSNLVCNSRDKDLILVVGADNYDLAYNLYPELHILNEKLKKKSKGKLFLFDCSLNKESVTKQFQEEVRLFDAFSVRESETLDNIKRVAPQINAYLIPDPAFIMPSLRTKLPAFWMEKKVIGINMSSLIVQDDYGVGVKTKVMSACQYLIDNILSKTDFTVVLIPHVMQRKDLAVLEEIKLLYPNEDRVSIISNENYTAPELKYIISNCRFFIGARTHATIAAYSSCVPTLVLGYSTKSKGIAKDLFGQTEGYVLPVQEIKDKSELWIRLHDIMVNEDRIKEHLITIMPDYQERAFAMSNVFKRLLS